MPVIPGQLRKWSGSLFSNRKGLFIVLELQEQHAENGDGAAGYRTYWNARVMCDDGSVESYTSRAIEVGSTLVSQ